MKKILACLLCSCLSLSVCACSGHPDAPTEVTTQATEPSVQTTEATVKGRKTLSVLAIGNSYSEDTTYYLYDIAKAEGYESISIGQLYIGGCSLEIHAGNAKENQYAYKFYTNSDGEWKMMSGCSMKYAIESQPWDVITVQQASTYSGVANSYEPYLTELINYINTYKTNPDARIAWHMTWAYQLDYDSTSFDKYNRNQMTMYQAITDAVQRRVASHEQIDLLIPSGTAVQNARSSYLGDNLSRDGTHMNDFGRVLTAYTWLAAIDGQPLEKVSITQVQTALQLTDKEKDLIVESVNAALAQPYAVTNSAYTD